MIRWMNTGNVSGFTYIPLLEVGLGVFLLIVGVLVVVLHFYFNGLNIHEWQNLLFVAAIFIFCMLLGKSLVWQKLKVTRDNASREFTFYQSLRGEPVNIKLKFEEVSGLEKDARTQGDETMTTIFLKTSGGKTEFYKSRSIKEIDTIIDAITKISKQE